MTQVSRRRFFHLLSALGAALPVSAADRAKRGMIVHSAQPEDFEMPLRGFDSWITPIEHFFVRSHMPRPAIDLAAWRLSVAGEVASPLSLPMSEVRKFPRAELVAVLECAGNGRGFYQPGVAGLQWMHGAAGNARWRGIRLADVLKRAGLKSSAKYLLFNGADTPPGTMPDFTRTIPVQKALDPDTLLAFDMNGETLPASHGYPLRLIAPGWAGDSWIKWITSITAIDKEHDGFFMKTAYRYPMRPVEPGTAVDASEMRPVEALRPKSVIVESSARGIRGVAWAGESPLVRVDVSTDGGQTWRPAKLGRDRARYAWRLWDFRRQGGSGAVIARATDAAGATQPLTQQWNPSGYLWNVAERQPAALEPRREIPPFPPKVARACLSCHGSDIIAGQRLTPAQWEREVNKMTGWGAIVNPADRNEILDFLIQRFGPR